MHRRDVHHPTERPPITDFGKWTGSELDRLLKKASSITDPGGRIAFLSQQFIGSPYRESTLIGSVSVRERLVINLREMDCFTYLDYVEAMRLSASYREFVRRLTHVRYRSGDVAYRSRRHFFSDWRSSRRVRDVTALIGGSGTVRLRKTINRKDDGSFYMPRITPVRREIRYVPTAGMTRASYAALATGDYLGIYSDSAGLDVSHVGIAVADKGRTMLRHASSIERKVVDQSLESYLQGKPGLIVFRPRPAHSLRSPLPH